jgi:hypothetical protein
MTAPPARNDVGGSGNPSRATAKAAFTALYDYAVERLGGTAATATSGEQDTACAAIGAVRKTGDTMEGNLDVPSLNGGHLAGLRNVLINGGMEINQAGLTSVADDAYCLDQWYALTESGNVTVAQQTDQENGTPFNIRLTQPDVTGKQIGLAQIIEASSSKRLRGKTATLALRVRNSAGAQINYAVLEWTGTADAVTSDVISAWAASPTYIGSITERAKGSITPAAATWTDAPGLNAAINASTNNLIVLIWSNADMAQSATLDISNVQFEPGSVATPFEVLPSSLVLSLCERFYEIGDLDSGGAAGTKYANGGGSGWHNSSHSFATKKRISPTMTVAAPTYENSSAISAAVVGTGGFATRVTVTAAGAYRAYSAPWTASARL